jgi:hypothetical protein
LLSVARDPNLPTLSDALERIPRYEAVLLNLEGASPVEAVLAYAAIASSPRVRETARPIIVVCRDDVFRTLLSATPLERRVLLERSLEDALRFLVGSWWLSAFAEVGA